MKFSDFDTGTEFQIHTGQCWRCTYTGHRTMPAIELDPHLDEAWLPMGRASETIGGS